VLERGTPHSSSSSGGKLGNGGGVLVVSNEMEGFVGLGIVYVVVATQSIGGSVTSASSPGGPSVTVLHRCSKQAGCVGQPKAPVLVGVTGHAGLRPGTVNVVGRRSIVRVQPVGGGVEDPVQVCHGAQGGGM
jgi:hypothetical protein